MRMNIRYESIADQIKISNLHTQRVRLFDFTSVSLFDFSKRVFDIFFSLFLIISLLPLWAIVVLGIKASSKGPIFYKARVIGIHSRFFTMLKFRTMFYNNSSQKHEKLVVDMIKNNKPCEKLKNDTRITPFGKYLRKFSVDEFPQLLNVLKGEMSLIGPRPCLPYEYEVMNNWHKKRFNVKPGMTGLWQVKGRNKIKFD